MSAFPPLRVVVAIPARDEAERLPATLSALAAQRGAPPFGVLVLANNCRDGTVAAAEAGRGQLTLRVQPWTLPPEDAHAGGARRTAMNLAATWAGEDGVVVSTDADTVAEQDWLAHLLAPLAQGADAACGRILLDAQERARLGVAARRTHLYDAAYHLAAANLSARLDPLAHDPAPRHAQHFGANLALTVRAYRAVGGIPDVSALEDVALIHALLRADLRVCHTPRARVRTSARLGGRVEVGLSSQLREWDVSGAAWRVPGGDEVAALARAQAAFRSAYRGVDVPELAALWLTPRRALGHALSAPTEGGGLELAHAARWAAGLWPVRYPPYPVEQALWSVRLLAHEHV